MASIKDEEDPHAITAPAIPAIPPTPAAPAARVFISYDGADMAVADAVAVLADELRQAGLDLCVGRADLPAGSPWRLELEQFLSASAAVVVVMGQAGVGKEQRPEVDLALERQEADPNLRLIPLLLPGAPALSGFLAKYTPMDARGRPVQEVVPALMATVGGLPPVAAPPPQPKAGRARYLLNALLLLGILVLGCLWYFRHLHAELTHLVVGGSITFLALLKFAYDCLKWSAEDELDNLPKLLLATRRSTGPLVVLLVVAAGALAFTSSVHVGLDETHRAQGKRVLTISQVADGKVVWTTPELNADHPTAGRIFLLRRGGPLRLVLTPGPGLRAWETNLPVWAVLRFDVPRDFPEREFRVARILPGPSLLMSLPAPDGPVETRYELELEANGQVQRIPDLRQQVLMLAASDEDLELAVAGESASVKRERFEHWLPGPAATAAAGPGAAIRASILARWEAGPRVVSWPGVPAASNLTVRLFRERASSPEPVRLRVSVLDAANRLQTLLIDREP